MSYPHALLQVLDVVLNLYSLALIAVALLSWIDPDPRHPAVQLLHRLTDPVLQPIRRVVPSLGGMDLSVLVALIGIYLLRRLLLQY